MGESSFAVDTYRQSHPQSSPPDLSAQTPVPRGGPTTNRGLGLIVATLPKFLATALHIPDAQGVQVLLVYPGSLAEKTGLTHSDVILEVNGQKVTTAEALASPDLGRSSTVTFKVFRSGQELVLSARR
jgi:S1-C subfamily serine protease